MLHNTQPDQAQRPHDVRRGELTPALPKDCLSPSCSPCADPVRATGRSRRRHCCVPRRARLCWSLMSPRPGSAPASSRKAAQGGARLRHPNNALCRDSASTARALPAHLLNTPHASRPVAYLGFETRVCWGQRLVHRAVLRRNVQGVRWGLFRNKLVCKPVSCHSFFLWWWQRWGLVAKAARRNEGLERQIERPSHLGRKGPVIPSAAHTSSTHPAPAAPAEGGRVTDFTEDGHSPTAPLTAAWSLRGPPSEGHRAKPGVTTSTSVEAQLLTCWW